MDPENNGDHVRLTRQQIMSLYRAVSNNANLQEIDVSHGTDGRLLAKEVVKVERLKALKLS